MSKVIAGSLVFVLAVGAAALGDLLDDVLGNAPGPFQDQYTLMHVDQAVSLLQGGQLALSAQELCVNNNQDIDGAYQGLLASVAQNTVADGQGASVTVGQELAIEADQQQFPADGYGLPIDAQGLALAGHQTLLRGDGEGGAGGLHAFDWTAQQMASGFDETASLAGQQAGNMFGAAGSNAQADTAMSVFTFQGQGI
jgi:hypothetical protein